MEIRVQRHASVSKQATLLDGIDVSPLKWRSMWELLKWMCSWRYEPHLKCKGSFKDSQWKCKYMKMNVFFFNSFSAYRKS